MSCFYDTLLTTLGCVENTEYFYDEWEVMVVESYSKLLHKYDLSTYLHSMRVCKYTLEFASFTEKLQGNSKEFLFSAILHDIGKISISKSILLKNGKLSEEEYKQVKMHSEFGANILKNFFQFHTIGKFILHHHENYDGSGYPTGLKGKHIPEVSRILRIIDSFDAMTSTRSYKEALTPEEALKEIQQNMGVLYDKELSLLFIDFINKKYIHKTGSGELDSCQKTYKK